MNYKIRMTSFEVVAPGSKVVKSIVFDGITCASEFAPRRAFSILGGRTELGTLVERLVDRVCWYQCITMGAEEKEEVLMDIKSMEDYFAEKYLSEWKPQWEPLDP